MQIKSEAEFRLSGLQRQEMTGENRAPRLTMAKRAVAEWLTIEEHDRVLDLSCDNGLLLQALNLRYHLRLCGMAKSAETARAVCAQLPEADVLAARALDIPWHDNAFDVVFSAVSAQAYENFDQVLGEVLRVLRPGGQFALLAPHTMDALNAPRLLMRRLQQAGFQSVSWRAFYWTGVCVCWKEIENG